MPTRRLVLGAALAAPFRALADSYPTKPIRVILPGPVGGLIDIAAEPLQAVAAEVGAVHAVADASDGAGLADALETVIGQLGGIEAAWSNVGYQTNGDADQTPVEQFDYSYAVNVRSHFVCARTAIPHLRGRGGSLLITASNSGLQTERSMIAYATTKHAVLALSHAAKFAGWEHGVRVTALCPGAVDTDFVAGLPGVTPGPGRIAPTTIAEAAAFLLRLPNNASVAELVVNARLESTL